MKKQLINISKYLTDNWHLLADYFAKDEMGKWQNDYEIKSKHIEHDEPWLTLVTTHMLFGDHVEMSSDRRLKAFNHLLQTSGMTEPPKIDKILDIQLEKQLPEIESFRKILKEKAFHYYQDSRETIDKKKQSLHASFEGPTHVDLYILCKSGDKVICMVIEAKFNSDISKDISYCPVRDQIIRNIDAAMDYKFDRELNIMIDDFCFILLTPKLFRTNLYGGNRKTPINNFQPQKSRLYCYKMDEYKDPKNLMQALPHRTGNEKHDWSRIAAQIGWITFEDMYRIALDFGTIDVKEKDMIKVFLEERNMIDN